MSRHLLLDRHAQTEVFGTSLHKLYSYIDQILSQGYEVHKVDSMFRFWSKQARQEYLTSVLFCETALLGSIATLYDLRRLGWQGKAVLMALGSLPRGGTGIRKAVSLLRPQDVVLISSSADKAIWDWFFTSSPRAEVVPFGVDENLYCPMDEEEVSQFRAQLGYQPDNRIILYSGRITVEKNVHSILPIFAELLRDHPNYVLFIAGKFQQIPFEEFGIQVNIAKSVKDLAEELNIPKHNIRFFSHMNDQELIKLYNAADVLINLSLHHDENFGFSQVEAMTCGTPVVATAWGGMKDTVRDDISGYLIPTWVTSSGLRFDRQLAKERILEVLENDVLRRRLSNNALHWARDQYSLEVFAQRLIATIEDQQLGLSKIRFSPSGLRYAWRFSRQNEQGNVVSLDPVAPHYSTYDDDDYARIIDHYTCGSVPEIHENTVCRRASYWHRIEQTPTGQLSVRNSDPLWPYTEMVDGVEVEMLQHIYSKESVTLRELTDRWGTDTKDLVQRLVRKGFVSCSSGSQGQMS